MHRSILDLRLNVSYIYCHFAILVDHKSCLCCLSIIKVIIHIQMNQGHQCLYTFIQGLIVKWREKGHSRQHWQTHYSCSCQQERRELKRCSLQLYILGKILTSSIPFFFHLSQTCESQIPAFKVYFPVDIVWSHTSCPCLVPLDCDFLSLLHAR